MNRKVNNFKISHVKYGDVDDTFQPEISKSNLLSLIAGFLSKSI